MLISQQELLKLADEAINKNKFDLAQQYLKQAQENGFEPIIAAKIASVELQQQAEGQAYLTIKEIPDFFSDLAVFATYQQVLQANHYLIEQLQLQQIIKLNFSKSDQAKYLAIIFENKVAEISEDEQTELLANFRQKDLVNLQNEDLLELYRLSEANFIKLIETILLDRYVPAPLRVSLIAELKKLNVKQPINQYSLDQIKQFTPSNTKILQETVLFQKGIELIMDFTSSAPELASEYLAEYGNVLQKLYPFAEDYVSDANDLFSAIEFKLNPDSGQKITNSEVAKLVRLIDEFNLF